MVDDREKTTSSKDPLISKSHRSEVTVPTVDNCTYPGSAECFVNTVRCVLTQVLRALNI